MRGPVANVVPEIVMGGSAAALRALAAASIAESESAEAFLGRDTDTQTDGDGDGEQANIRMDSKNIRTYHLSQIKSYHQIATSRNLFNASAAAGTGPRLLLQPLQRQVVQFVQQGMTAGGGGGLVDSVRECMLTTTMSAPG